MIELRFANYFSNHMVLQGSPHKPVIWGYGPKPTDYKNISVIVRLYMFDSSKQSIATKQHTNVLTTEASVKDDSLSKYLAEVEPEYRYTSQVQRAAAGNTWRVTLEPPTHKGPYLITASLIGQSEDQVIKLRDVMFGDVWVCTGHDRGLDRLNKIANFTDSDNTNINEGDDGDEDDLRIFSVFPAKSDVPWPDIHLYDIPWTIASKSKAPRIRDRSGSYSPIFPGPCWHFGHKLRRHLKRPLGLISAIYNENLPEEWLPSQALNVSEKTYLESSSRNWNGMIHPLLDVQIRGVIFQQGDAFEDDDRDQKEKEKKEKSKKSSSDYRYFFKKFTHHWRMGVRSRTQPHSSASGGGDSNDESNLNNDDTPLILFGIIQALPNNNSQSKSLATASNRWRATANRGYLPNSDLDSTFLAVSIDLPDMEDIRQKQKLGERLLRGAVHVAYHEKVEHKGPTPFEYVNVKKKDLTLNFNTNIIVKSDFGFEICCSKTPRNQTCKGPEDKAAGFYWDHVIVTSSTNKSVTLNTENCPWHTVGFRYAWADEPCEFESCPVYSVRTNLPMPSLIHLHMLDDGKPKKLHLDLVDV
ncbi:hypothetical protein HELRODRAFT_108727 [Helobdella robusta]|uniref:Uncharacterized protein n=1 Tax=Helobdella robusta TaxID=6412 RepID=T1EEL9_HELRO|nr:hypothetical protein HELRODRAFT_108727 [Helobdella robusta]ESN90664.1 hypothetical protein HELRODRAFT_108727 [Helobdella robusta]